MPHHKDPTKVRVSAQDLLTRDSGKGAVFIAAFLAFLSEHGESPLNQVQRTSMDWVTGQGESMSLNYMKVCCRDLQDAGLIEYTRSGRNYSVEITDRGVAWFDSLPEGWGTSLDPRKYANATPEAAEEVSRRPNRRVKGGTRLDSKLWRAYMAAQNRGELDIVFVPAGSEVRVGARGRFSAYDPGQRAE